MKGIDWCPFCGRQEVVEKGMELSCCSICIQHKVDVYRKKLGKLKVTGKVIKRIRARRGLSSEALGAILNIPEIKLSKMEKDIIPIHSGLYGWVAKEIEQKGIPGYG